MKRKILILFAMMCVILFVFAIVFNLFVFPEKFKNYVIKYSNEFNLETPLVYAIIKTESDFDKKAVSASGAMGLMQLMPNTAKWIANQLGVDYHENLMFSASENVRFGCYYLRYLFDKFNQMDIVVCAYNAGEVKVLDWIDEQGNLNESKIDFGETKNYLLKVKKFYRVYKEKRVNI